MNEHFLQKSSWKVLPRKKRLVLQIYNRQSNQMCCFSMDGLGLCLLLWLNNASSLVLKSLCSLVNGLYGCPNWSDIWILFSKGMGSLILHMAGQTNHTFVEEKWSLLFKQCWLPKLEERPNPANQPQNMKPQGVSNANVTAPKMVTQRFLGWNFQFTFSFSLWTQSPNSDKRHSWKAIHLPIIHRPRTIHNSKSKWEELGTLKIRRTMNPLFE